jgi:hypothetical protein
MTGPETTTKFVDIPVFVGDGLCSVRFARDEFEAMQVRAKGRAELDEMIRDAAEGRPTPRRGGTSGWI